jgi:outer membrane receptor for Fe3+-dicitrate
MISFGMGSQRSSAIGLEYLLGLDGNIEVQNDAGYWVKMEVSSVDVTAERPYGIRYSLTLHAPDNTRLIGFDNAHSVRPAGSRFKHAGKRFPYDHRHRHALDEGVLYEFDTAYQLVSDFYAEVDRVLKEVSP